ncbi:MAG TPA: TauD/TfdA family dioxygenase [Steroidobacteraceae bacterium]
MSKGQITLRIDSPTRLSVAYGNGESYEVHPIWLRERSSDVASMDLLTGQRLHDPSDLDLSLHLVSIEEFEHGRLKVKFSDGHETLFAVSDILAEAAMPPGDQDCPAGRVWDGTLRDLPRAQWQTQPSEAERLDWTARFLEYGFIIFSGVPCADREVLKVASAFGFTRETNFGAFFDVRSEPNASDLAYTALHLDPHTDNPYRSPVPGVQLLHCLANKTSGGLSTLVDGIAVGEALRIRDPQAFRVLSTTPVRFRYRDSITELVASAPLIELDVSGHVRTIHFSPRLDFVPLLPLDQLTAYYRARHLFDHMLRSTEFEIRFLLQSGDLVMFDNCRLLHGRTGFDPIEGLRHLQGCYIDIDGPRSLYRVLRRQPGSVST